MNHLISLFILLLSFVSFKTIANQLLKPVSVGIFEISELLNPLDKKPGPYNLILNEFSGLEPFFTTPGRADELFNNKKLDCLFPASTAVMNKSGLYISSLPVNQTKAYIFSLEPYNNIKEFEGKILTIRRGLSIGKFKKRFSANFVDINSDSAMIRFLHKKRADGIVAYLVDMQSAYKSLNLPVDYYQIEAPIHTSNDAFVCHKTKDNQRHITAIDQTIQRLITSGKLKRLLAEVN